MDIPELKETTGHNQAVAVLEALEEWNLLTVVKGMYFDTTVTNTGNSNQILFLIYKQQTLTYHLLEMLHES